MGGDGGRSIDIWTHMAKVKKEANGRLTRQTVQPLVWLIREDKY
jgi:hypothetical protein